MYNKKIKKIEKMEKLSLLELAVGHRWRDIRSMFQKKQVLDVHFYATGHLANQCVLSGCDVMIPNVAGFL